MEGIADARKQNRQNASATPTSMPVLCAVQNPKRLIEFSRAFASVPIQPGPITSGAFHIQTVMPRIANVLRTRKPFSN
jgi:hypothetical protein